MFWAGFAAVAIVLAVVICFACLFFYTQWWLGLAIFLIDVRKKSEEKTDQFSSSDVDQQQQDVADNAIAFYRRLELQIERGGGLLRLSQSKENVSSCRLGCLV